jgi:Dolichyl-phosphate-mannose-protein mannosyltransferase
MILRSVVHNERVAALIIVCIGLGLRLIAAAVLPLYNDELSALYRSDYKTIGELFQRGILPDGHPFLAQFIVWVTRHTIGTTEFALRLPFVLASAWGLWGWYLGARRFSNTPWPALLFVATLATSEMLLYLGSLARPYALGFCAIGWAFALIANWWQQQQLAVSGRVGLTVAFTAAVAAHYMAGLVAVVLFFIGLCWVNRSQRRAFLVTGLGAVVLFSPHLPITLQQLGQGGLGWLGAPTFASVMDGLAAYLPASTIVGNSLVMLVIVAGIALSIRRSTRKQTAGLLVLFFVPLTIAIVYSWLQAPVLHYMAFIFMFPFAVLAALAWFDRAQLSVWFSVIVAGIFALCTVYLDNFYSKTHNGDFRQATALLANWADEMGREGLVAVANVNNPMYHLYYNNRLENPINLAIAQFDSAGQAAQFLDTCTATKLIFYSVNRGDGSTAETLLKSQFAVNNRSWNDLGTLVWAGHRIPHAPRPETVSDSLRNFLEGSEYLTGAELLLNGSARYAIAGSWAAITPEELTALEPLLLVMIVEHGGKSLHWHATDIRQAQRTENGNCFLVCAIELPAEYPIGAVVKAYWWNRQKKAISVGTIELVSVD